jgi:plasmid stabilization system protein ParE
MAREVVWSAAAEADIAEIGSYLERVASLAVATTVITKIRAGAFGVVDFHYAYRMVPEFQDPDRREIFVFEYRLMYRVESSRITVLRVVHGRRLLSNVPGSFEESQAEYSAA